MQNVNPVEIDTEIAKNDAEIQTLMARLDVLRKRNAKLDEVYRANRWTRFYPAVTNSQPHIHSSTRCQTLHRGQYMTTMTWATQMSGTTEAEAVEELDEALCSICFPTSPVALHDYVSRKSQEAQAERAAAKAERQAVQDAKRLSADQVFRTHDGDRVETVAKLKELVRAPFASSAELDWFATGKGRAAYLKANTWMTEDDADEAVTRVSGNVRQRYEGECADAAKAEALLVAREAAHAGHGATEQDIAKMQQSAAKRAAKDWA